MAQPGTPDDADGPDGRESFEALFVRLEQVAALLEAGDAPLERSLALYEEGMGLARRCRELLADAEQRVERLREVFADEPGTEPAPAAGGPGDGPPP